MNYLVDEMWFVLGMKSPGQCESRNLICMAQIVVIVLQKVVPLPAIVCLTIWILCGLMIFLFTLKIQSISFEDYEVEKVQI